MLNSRIQIEQLRSATTKLTGYSLFWKGTGYEYDGNVFVAWVLQVRRAEVVTKWSTGFRTWTSILQRLITYWVMNTEYRGYEYDGFLDFLNSIVFNSLNDNLWIFLYNFLFVVYFYSNKIWCIEQLVLQYTIKPIDFTGMSTSQSTTHTSQY